MLEIWKDIKGYEGLYQISSWGRVYSYYINDFLNLKPDKRGYIRVTLSKNKLTKRFLVHRLVAQAFIPNPDNLPDVNHKDENKENNHVDNLEWCTREYNMNYGTRNERAKEEISKTMKEKFKNGYKSPFKDKHHTEEVKNYLSRINSNENHPLATAVICVTTGEIFTTIKEAGNKYNVNPSSISKCCRHKRKSAGKHPITKEKLVWEYID